MNEGAPKFSLRQRMLGWLCPWAQLLCGLLILLPLGPGWAQTQSPSADAFNPWPLNLVGALALQTDGRILLGGDFIRVGPQTHERLARVSTEGVVESGFNPAADEMVYCLALQPDGKILVGGDFVSFAGQTCRAIGRLNTNGTYDTTFTTHVFEPPPFTTIDARVQAILVLPDGKIVIGGRKSLNGSPMQGFVSRLNTNGLADTTFVSVSIGGGPVDTLALQPDGRILVGGQFSSVNSRALYRLARLNSDGSLDTSFDANVDSSTGTAVTALAVQPDQSILVGGSFNTVAGQPHTNLARVDVNGTLDPSFHPQVRGGYGSVYSLALQTDGRILVGGLFTFVDGIPHSRLARLLPDGTLDGAFTAGASADVYGLALQADGRLLACGYLTSLAGQPRNGVGRLNTLEPAWQHLNYDGATITWSRGGSCCEIWCCTFEASTDSIAWTDLGEGTRIPGGWELANVSLALGTQIRARGRVAGGGYNASSWLVESIWPSARPGIVTSDTAFGVSSNCFGFNMTGTPGSTVIVEGSTNLTFWMPVATNVLLTPKLYFSDLAWTNCPSRCYRVRNGVSP